ncbi:putative Phage protein [Xenorhabdus poinarii G6]|uniref:Putative Phage protein n=1 Tax=Xenorhabdus poinarii G6 TaxID=1354304 RepID=A0A068R4M0_9GAMM|nr:phage related-protein [Xenorhabdus poinarii]CDG21070.1 putative Phage protein [Xenorhabdus poinarii G6]
MSLLDTFVQVFEFDTRQADAAFDQFRRSTDDIIADMRRAQQAAESGAGGFGSFVQALATSLQDISGSDGIDIDVDLHDTQEKLTSVREKISELESTIAALDSQREQASQGMQDSNATVSELTAQYDQLQAELTSLNGELNSLTDAEQKNAKAKEAVNAIVEALQADYAKFVETMRTKGIQAAIEEAKAQSHLQRMLTDTEGKYKAAGESVAGFATKALGAVGIVMSLGAIFSDAVSRSQEIEALDRLGKKIGVATADVDAFGGALAELGGSREAAQSDLEAMAKSFGNTTNSMEKILATADRVKGMKFDKAKATLAGMGVSDEKTVELMMKGRKELERVMGIQKEYSGITKESIEKSIKFNAAMSKFRQSSGLLKNSFLEMVIPVLVKGMDWLSKFIDFCKSNKQLIIGFFLAVGIAIAAYYVPPMLAAAAATLAATWPILAIIAIIALLATAFAIVYDDIMNFIEGNDSMIGRLLDKYPMLKKVIMALWEAWQVLFGYLKVAVKFVADIVVSAFNYMDQKITAFINWLLDSIASLTKWSSQFSGVFDTVSDAVVGAFKWMWEQVEKIIGWISQGLDAVSKGISTVKGWFGFGSDKPVNLEQNVEQTVTNKDAEQYLDVLAAKRKSAQESGMDTGDLDQEIRLLRQQLADGKSAADVVAGVEAANKKLMMASQNPLNPVTSQAISNQSHQTNEVNTQIGEVNIKTAATDAQGIANDMRSELSNQLKDLGQQTATGVAK